ncbi:MAG: hypothetical protein IT201_03260 [Thermoleophilia bacterium]|nr:hypothetical protein [Thermoleophilia bacterium]
MVSSAAGSTGDSQAPPTRELRNRCRAALGEECIRRWERISTRMSGLERGVVIPIHDGLVAWDELWLRERRESLLAAFVGLREVDVEARRARGSSLRRRAGEMAEQAERWLDLIEFLVSFDSEVAAAYADYAGALILTANTYVRSISYENDEVAVELGRDLEASLPRISGESVRRVVEKKRRDFSQAEAISVGFGLQVQTSVHSWQAALQNVREPGLRLLLASRQLARLVDVFSMPPEAASIALTNAVGLCTSPCPLLSHRVAGLVLGLVRAARTASPEETAELYRRFYAVQPGLILEAEDSISDSVRAAYGAEADARHLKHLVGAYRALAEGMLRPFGELALSLDALVRGEAPRSAARPRLLGVVESELAALGTELGTLLSLGVLRNLRNADAHLELFVSHVGELSVIERDGTATAIDPSEFDRRHRLLRAALYGADIGFGLARWTEADIDLAPADDARMPTESLLRSQVELATIELTRGRIERFTIASCGSVSIVFGGPATKTELRRYLADLAAVPSLRGRAVRVVAEDGRLLIGGRVPADETDRGEAFRGRTQKTQGQRRRGRK